MTGWLEGHRVVDLTTGIAGAYATKLLADAGAEVVLVEPPEGHPLRALVGLGRAHRRRRAAVPVPVGRQGVGRGRRRRPRGDS